MDTIERGIQLIQTSFSIVFKHKKLLVFSFLSALSSLLVVFIFLGPLFVTGEPFVDLQSSLTQARGTLERIKGEPTLYYGYTFAAYFSLYFIAVFFNTAMISCVVAAFKGEKPSLSKGFAAAMSRLHYITGWVLVNATVGLILSIIQNRSNKIGKVITGLFGIAWSVATYFVVPVMAVNRTGPFAAMGQSVEILKKTWGENLVAGFGFGVIFMILRGFWIVFMAFGFFFGGAAVGMFFILSLVYLFILELLRVAMEPVFLAAVYLYARDGIVPDGIDKGLIAESFLLNE